MKRVLFLSLFFAAAAWADDPRAAFEAGNPAEAARQLEAQLALRPSAEGYYNLGLAREKAGEHVPALLEYERALLLDPGLRAARNARSQLAATQGVPAPPRTWIDDVTAVAHPDLLFTLGGVVAWLGAFGLVAATQSRHRAGHTVLAGIALVLGGGAAAAGWLTDARLSVARPALVTGKDGVEVLSSPANNSNAIVQLPAGSPVRVISPRGAWTYVDLAGGARGWVQTARLTPVIPGETL